MGETLFCAAAAAAAAFWVALACVMNLSNFEMRANGFCRPFLFFPLPSSPSSSPEIVLELKDPVADSSSSDSSSLPAVVASELPLDMFPPPAAAPSPGTPSATSTSRSSSSSSWSALEEEDFPVGSEDDSVTVCADASSSSSCCCCESPSAEGPGEGVAG